METTKNQLEFDFWYSQIGNKTRKLLTIIGIDIIECYNKFWSDKKIANKKGVQIIDCYFVNRKENIRTGFQLSGLTVENGKAIAYNEPEFN